MSRTPGTARVFLATFFVFLLWSGTVSGGEGMPANVFTIRADWWDRGNVTTGEKYAKRHPAVVNAGILPNRAEYDITFPAPGRYELQVLYAAQQSRPVEIALDDVAVSQGIRSTTGSWNTDSARWEKQAELSIDAAGTHTIRLTALNMFPHLCALRLIPLDAPKVSWPLPRPVAAKQVEALKPAGPRPNNQNGDWYLNVAIDRLAKEESGQTFSDHFAGETSLALLPAEAISYTISKRSSAMDETKPDWHDELSYRAGMFGTPAQRPSSPQTLETLEWCVRIERKASSGQQAASPAGRRIPLRAAHYSEMLRRSLALIESHRKTGFVPRDYLEREKQRLLTLRQTDAAWQEEFRRVIDPGDESVLETARKFFDDYLELIRLYSLIARSNPLLDFENLLFVRRRASNLGLPKNWQSNSVLRTKAFDDRLMALTLRSPEGHATRPTARTLYKPEHPTFLGDLDLHFDAERALVSMTNEQGRWNVFELDLTASRPARAMLDFMEDANHYDACYLVDDSFLFTSSMPMIGVPCVNGKTPVTNMYRKYNDGTIRRLTFDQDHNWCPVLMPDGRVMYQRWEYADIPHAHSRLLFLMNPDGSMQTAHYGSNSYWPNSLFYARPIPNDASQFIAVVGGHHGVARMGELVLFDVRRGRTENAGAVERICGSPKKVASKTNPKYDSTLIVDNLVDESWPKFLHPFPLDEHYYLVAAQPDKESLWGIYLVDRHDNMILLHEEADFACFEPVPWKKTRRPPEIVDRRDDSQTEATIHLSDIYFGDGLRGVPRGTVKNLRIISYNYLFPNVGGPQGVVGMEGPWDVRTIHGTVPVRDDGSAVFTVPANTPLAVQPLDENGQALQLMRSWFTAVPGEVLTCIGCHEDKNQAPPALGALPSGSYKVTPIKPWYGPARGFSFVREVQPVLDHYCIACHDGREWKPGVTPFDLRGLEKIKGYKSAFHDGRQDSGNFTTSYAALHRYVRRPGMESDYVLLNPLEFAANTTELIQILRRDHYGLRMDAEAWDRIVTWIDLNAPFHGTQGENMGEERIGRSRDRRLELMKLYANLDDRTEEVIHAPYDPRRSGSLWNTGHSIPFGNPFVLPAESERWRKSAATTCFPSGEQLRAQWLNGSPGDRNDQSARKNSPADGSKAKEQQRLAAQARGGTTKRQIRIDDRHDLELTLIPASESDVLPRPFWMGTFEITNAQFEAFDPTHDSRVESRPGMQFGVRGFYVNAPELPVVRVSWERAAAYCRWLTEKTGKKFRLPTDAEWEHAARAGSSTPFFYGDADTDFSPFANLADATLVELICHPYYKERRPIKASVYDDWVPKIASVNDGGFLSEPPGRYRPNAWGLYDMHGNVAEWTVSSTPCGRERIVRGGSWHDRPYRAANEFKASFLPWQQVFDVGFRVVCEEMD